MPALGRARPARPFRPGDRTRRDVFVVDDEHGAGSGEGRVAVDLLRVDADRDLMLKLGPEVHPFALVHPLHVLADRADRGARGRGLSDPDIFPADLGGRYQVPHLSRSHLGWLRHRLARVLAAAVHAPHHEDRPVFPVDHVPVQCRKCRK